MKKEYCNIGDDRRETSLGQGKDAAIHISSTGLQVTGQTSKPYNNRRRIIEISRLGLCRQGQKIQRLDMVPYQREWSLYVNLQTSMIFKQFKE
jgi:hypothetical protein